MKKYPLYNLVTVALLSLATFGEANAQESGFRLPGHNQVEKERITPKQLQERQAEAKAKHPLLHLRKLPTITRGNSEGLTRLNTGKTGVKPTLSTPRVRNAQTVTLSNGRKLWGNVLYDSSWQTMGSDYTAYGWYEFMPQSPLKVSSVFNFDYLRATGSGAWIGNTLYYVWYQNFWGIDMIYYYKLNTDTWEQIGTEETLPDCSLMANETAIAPDGTTVYGDYLDAEGMNNELCIVDYETKSRTLIGRLRQAYVALGMTSDSKLYGVAVDGNLYLIDTNTAAETLIGSTGVQIKMSDGSFYYQSGEIDQKTNTFYWASVNANSKSTLYTVNLTDASLTKVGDFEGNNMITLLSIPKPLAEDGAPAIATDLSFDFKNGSLTGDVCFTAPSTTFAGDELKGEITYEISDGKTTLATGSTTPGADVRQQVTVKDNGTTNFIVTTANSVGTSPKLIGSTFVGFDQPKPAGDVKTVLDSATGTATVTWSAPTSTINGGYMGDITYNVVRYPDGKVITTGTSETSVTDQLPADAEMSVYGYGVTPLNGAVKGEESVSNYVSYGKPCTPPFLGGFDEESEMALYKIIDGNNDGVTWTWVAPSLSNDMDALVSTQRSENGAADDWLITPALNVKANHAYTVSFRISGQSKYYTQKYEVKYGTKNTAGGMTKTLIAAKNLETSDYITEKETFIADKDETIYIGFHDCSLAKQWGIKLDDISVSAGVSVNAPDVATDLKVEAGEKGALEAKLTFKAPTKTYSGNQLSKINKFIIRRSGKSVGEAPAAAPGSTVTYTDKTAVNGTNVYSVAVENDEGTSFYSTPVAVYVGISAPTVPTNRRTEEKPDKAVFNWDAPTAGEYGGYVDPAQLTYNIAERGGSDFYPSYDAVTSVKGKTTAEIAMSTNTGDQQLKTLWINAQNEYGESSYKPLPSIMLGKPYEIPFFESVSQKMLKGRLWTTDKIGNSDFWISDETYPDCVDNDNGSFYMKSEGDDWAILGTGKIDINGASEPKLVFFHKAKPNSKAKIKVVVERPNGTADDVALIDYSSLSEDKWNVSAVSLADYAEDDFISLDFYVQAPQGDVVYIDRMSVRDTYTYDLNAEISAPEKVKKGETAKVAVTVNNFGSKDARGYKVELYADGELVLTETPSEPLKAYEFRTFNFDYKTNILDENQSVELKAMVAYNNDLNTDDNAASTTVIFKTSDKPKPETAYAMNTDQGVQVGWKAVDTKSQTVTESFENYTPWATDVFGEWESVAKITGTTGGPFTMQYPSQGTSFGFTLAAPLSNWLTEEQLAQVPGFKAHTGNQYLASFYRVDDEGYDIDQNNWLFSPELSGEKQTVTFWVKNENDGTTTYAETFDVLYSTTDREEASFTKIGDTHTASSAKWEEVSVELPAGTKYFAINHNTTATSSFVFMIDDITYSYGPGAVASYNIYRDGNLIGNVAADKTSFVDTSAEAGKTYTYGVTAVFADGESEATIATLVTDGIQAIFTDGRTFDVYTVDGKLAGRNVKSLSTLKKGIYVVNGTKIVVK